MTCADCGEALGSRNRTGRCRRCQMRIHNREFKVRHPAVQRASSMERRLCAIVEAYRAYAWACEADMAGERVDVDHAMGDFFGQIDEAQAWLTSLNEIEP